MRLGMGLGLGNLLSGQPLTGFPNDFSFNFDGSNDYLDLGTDLESWVESPNKSLSIWVKNDGNTDSARIFNVGYADPNNTGFALGIDDGTDNKPFYFLRDTSAGVLKAEFGDVLNTTDWYHFAISIDGTANEAYIYQNGDLKVTVSNVGEPAQTTNQTAKIGKHFASDTDAYFNGLIDEVAIWDITLSAPDVAKIASKPVDFSKASTYATDRTSNLKLWLRAGDKVLPESDASIARSDFYTDFDGTDDYVDVGVTNLGLSSEATFSFWAKNNNADIDTDEYIASKYVTSGGNNRSWLIRFLDDEKLRIVWSSDGTNFSFTSTSSAVSNINTWRHYVITFDSGVPKIYIDGQDTTIDSVTNSSGLQTSFYNSSANIYIGRYGNDNNTNWEGAISNLSIYQTALDSMTISKMASNGRYTPMRDNRFSAVSFDGGDEYIAVPDNDSLDIGTGNVTVSAWVKPTDLDANYTILDKRGSDQLGILFLIHSGDRFFFQISDGTDDYYDYSGSLLTLGQWHHVCAVWNPSTTYANFYLDGVDVGRQFDSTNANVGNSDNTSELRIGRASSGYTNNYFKGSISSVSLYNVEKSAEEVYAIYQQGITYDESSLSGLQGYWRMGDDTSKAYPTIADSSSNSNDGTMTAGQSTDIVQQMISGYDMGAFESTGEELGGDFARAVTADSWTAYANMTVNTITDGVSIVAPTTASGVSVSSNGAFIHFRGGTYFGENQLTTKDLEIGKIYSVTFNAFYSGGASGVYADIYNSSESVFSDEFTTTSTSYTIVFEAKNATTGLLRFQQIKLDNTVYITDITVKEVLQSADLSDTYPAIIDVNEPVLGVEVNTVANATSPTNETNATTGWERSDTVNSTLEVVSNETYSGNYSLKFTATTAGDMLNTASTFTVESGVLYKVSITWKSEGTEVNGFSMGWGTTKNGGDYVNQQVDESTDWVTTTNYIKTTTTTLGAFIHEGAGASDTKTIYIDSVTIKKVQGNVGTMTNQDSADLVYSSVLPDQSFLTGVNSAYNFIDLDGGDQYIDAGALDSALVPPLSISMWVKGNSQSGATLIQDDAIGSGLLYTRAGNEISLYTTAGEKSYSYTLNNTWVNIVLTQASSAKPLVYVNGSLLSDGSQDNTPNPSFSNIRIGGDSTEFNGSIGQSAIWNKVLSSTEVGAIYTLGRHGNLLDSYSDNLKGYWAMSTLDALTGLSDSISTIYDRSGNSNHGTPQNADAGDLASSPNATPNGYSKNETNRSNNTP